MNLNSTNSYAVQTYKNSTVSAKKYYRVNIHVYLIIATVDKASNDVNSFKWR